MADTSVSLLDRLRFTSSDADWAKLHAVYQPLILDWLRRIPGLRCEADDVVQDVMLVLLRELPRFERQRDGSFRTWLRRVTTNRVRTVCRQRVRQPRPVDPQTEAFLDSLDDPAGEWTAEWERDHDRHVFNRLEELIRPDFHPDTWAAYRRFAVDGAPADVVAAELGLTRNAVVLAKARVLRRLREEAGALLDGP